MLRANGTSQPAMLLGHSGAELGLGFMKHGYYGAVVSTEPEHELM